MNCLYFRRLKDLREYHDLKQIVYSRYERGFQTIPIEHLIKLADYYNVSVDYILERTNKTELTK
ncbi:MAG: helix-turn-helix transcriptional regulator [Acutalibacteraceae bacterium]